MPELIRCEKCHSGVFEGDTCHFCGHKPIKKLSDKDLVFKVNRVPHTPYKERDKEERDAKMDVDTSYCKKCNCFEDSKTHKCKIYAPRMP